MRVLLLSTYELGHQPMGLATAAGGLVAAGHQARSVDLSLDPLDAGDLGWADAVAVSVPMHTATRLAVATVDSIRQTRPVVPIAAYGLYAGAAMGEGAFDAAFAGEYEADLAAWVDGLAGGDPAPRAGREVHVDLGRRRMPTPDRRGLAGLDRYGHLLLDGDERPVGYTEASRGCSHRCRHCPVPVVYDGRTRMVDPDRVAEDVDRLVGLGAEHITFGDPDFLNGPQHALKVVRRLAAEHPGLSFDATVKVEHILRHHQIWAEMSEAGLLFVVSAFESTNDDVLARLAKNHTAQEAGEAVVLLRAHGIEIRPSWLPFTPWTEMGDPTALVDFVIDADLVDNVDPVQYSIRLLVPPGSLLLRPDDGPAVFGPYDPSSLTHPWSSARPALDQLAAELAAVAEATAGQEPRQGFRAVHAAVDRFSRAHGLARPKDVPADHGRRVARLSEPWFCCAEPTGEQSSRMIGPVVAAGGAGGAS